VVSVTTTTTNAATTTSTAAAATAATTASNTGRGFNSNSPGSILNEMRRQIDGSSGADGNRYNDRNGGAHQGAQSLLGLTFRSTSPNNRFNNNRNVVDYSRPADESYMMTSSSNSQILTNMIKNPAAGGSNFNFNSNFNCNHSLTSDESLSLAGRIMRTVGDSSQYHPGLQPSLTVPCIVKRVDRVPVTRKVNV
jgi:hypothetical protein